MLHFKPFIFYCNFYQIIHLDHSWKIQSPFIDTQTFGDGCTRRKSYWPVNTRYGRIQRDGKSCSRKEYRSIQVIANFDNFWFIKIGIDLIHNILEHISKIIILYSCKGNTFSLAGQDQRTLQIRLQWTHQRYQTYQS